MLVFSWFKSTYVNKNLLDNKSSFNFIFSIFLLSSIAFGAIKILSRGIEKCFEIEEAE